MEKYKVLIETIVVIVIIIVLVITKAIPDLKKDLGSSDHLINTEEVNKLIEININNNLFGYELSKDNKVVNIIFYNETSLVFYNKKIENLYLSEAINKSLEILQSKNKLTTINKIIVTKYEDSTNYKSYFNNINSNYKEYNSKYNDLITKYDLTGTNKGDILYSLNIKSKDYVLEAKNIDITEYTDYVYKKLLIYKTENNIKNEKKNTHDLLITSIKVNNTYPTNNSYYYISNDKIYAYIELEINNLEIGYCYEGSLKDYKKEKCE